MNNLADVWSKRFEHYLTEIQKYMRFVFTGHLAIVLVFAIGALGYQYSEWLQVVSPEFPAEWLVAGVIGIVVAFSRPVTLLREPDQVYLLPLEKEMHLYFRKALNWTFWSQVFLPVICYIVSIPLLNAVTDLPAWRTWLGLLFIIVLKFVNVQSEFHYRFANRGNHVVFDRIARMAVSILAIQAILSVSFWWALIYLLLLVVYKFSLAKRAKVQPIPYEHLVKLEENRMMAFYRFANYFTDVPHIRGAVKRRAWLDAIYKFVPYKKENTQSYLVFRTFVRTNDHFYLWVRLTLISAIIALMIDIPVILWIVAGALSFATVIQLKYALLSSTEFRMDMLYPVKDNQRKQAVQKLLRLFMVIQAIIVMLCAIGQPLFFIPAIIVIGMNELTFRLSKDPAVHV